MILHPQPIPAVPDETARVAHIAFQGGNRYVQLRDRLGTIFQDEDFSDLYPNVGCTGIAPWRLALVTLMQFAENLSDREAADAVRSRIDWKYALSLELSDPGFDYSVLTEFRQRLLQHQAETQLFERLLEVLQSHDLLIASGRQRTDATHILGQVRDLSRLELIGESLRAALNRVARCEPDWLKSWVLTSWFDRYSKPFSEYHLPKKTSERQTQAEQIGQDSITLLEQIYSDTAPPTLRHLTSVTFLHRLCIYQFYMDESGIHWRDPSEAPASFRFSSPHDLDMSYGRKRGSDWIGYKVQITETCDDDAPNLITHVATTISSKNDAATLGAIQSELAARQRAPTQQFVDASYVSAPNMVRSQAQYGIDLIGPTRLAQRWQYKQLNTYPAAAFQVDFDRQVTICPQGQTSHLWMNSHHSNGQPRIFVRFAKEICAACPARAQCTKTKTRGRQVQFHIRAEYEALKRAREREQTSGYERLYSRQAGIERTMSQLTNQMGMRRTRYRGMVKVHLQHLLTAAGLKLNRATDWLMGKKRAKTRVSAFATLAYA
ncbi:MAG: IS5/IS1182 family transposase [Anaerolineaceae bacterium]|nr:IS5/IS1182 family transposase [Anaerolineaceae bacterium]